MEELARATAKDREEIAALLAASGLTHDDAALRLDRLTVARSGSRVVGVVGLEVHGGDGLVRSLAVAQDHRGKGVARRLYVSVLAEAARLGLARLFVLTPTAIAWFALLGFRAVAADGVPDALRASPEYRALTARGAKLIFRPMRRA